MQKPKGQIWAFTGALALACGLWSSPATSQTTTSFGAPDCGQWIADKTPTRRGWLMGYLSGLNRLHNAVGNKPDDPLDAMSSAEQAYLWMDNWCKANPLQKVTEGSMELFIELMNKKKK